MKINQIVTSLALASGLMLTASQVLAADQNTTFSPAQKTQIESITRNYLLNNPNVIVDSIKNLQEKQFEDMRAKAQKGALKNADSLFNSANDPIAGNKAGTVTVVEFFDYQCPHCVDMVPVIDSLIKKDSNLRVVYKEFPIRGPLSQLASKAALAAKQQGKYDEFHEGLMKIAQSISEKSIMDLAKSLGLDTAKFKADMNSDVVNNQIKANYKLAQDLELAGTPAIFVANTSGPVKVVEFIPGQVDEVTLQKVIDKAK